MDVKQLPSAEYLSQLLDYDSSTGALKWRQRTPDMFVGKNAETVCKIWNKKYAHTQAGRVTDKGYRAIKVDCSAYMAHRIAWKLTHGTDPEFIDHQNGNRDDNRIVNLRDVGRAENMQNRKSPINNKSGCMGVWWYEKAKRWRADITIAGKRVQLGQHKSYEEAVASRKNAEKTFGYHENHGRAAV